MNGNSSREQINDRYFNRNRVTSVSQIFVCMFLIQKITQNRKKIEFRYFSNNLKNNQGRSFIFGFIIPLFSLIFKLNESHMKHITQAFNKLIYVIVKLESGEL